MPNQPNNSPLTRNVLTNLLAFGFGLGITFVLSPYLIHSLGDARYGAWVLIAELLGYYGLLDLGIRGAVTFHVATYLAREQHERVLQLVASAFWILVLFGAIAAAGGVSMALGFRYVFIGQGTDSAEISVAMTILSCTLGASLPMEVFSASLVAQQRLDIVNAVEMGNRFLVAVGILAVLAEGGGLVALSLLQAGGKVVSWICLYICLKRCLPAISLDVRHFRRGELKALTGIGSKAFAINIATTVLQRTDLVLIGIFMEVKWVTYYSLGRMLIVYAESAVFQVARAYTPKLTELFAQDKRPELTDLFLNGARFAGTIAIIMMVGVWSFAASFLELWVGAEYVSGPLTLRSDIVAYLLGAANLPRMIQSISRQLIFATGNLSFLMWLSVFEAAANIGLTVVLVQHYGLAGVAMGTLLPVVSSQVLAMPWYMSRRLAIPQHQWLKDGLGRPAIVGGLTFAVAQVLSRAYPPTTWMVFGAEVSIVCISALTMVIRLVLRPQERALLREKLGVQVGSKP